MMTADVHNDDSKCRTAGCSPDVLMHDIVYMINRIKFPLVLLLLLLLYTWFIQIKTMRMNGLIMYSGPNPALPHSRVQRGQNERDPVIQDFVAVELVDGVLRYVFDVGGLGARVLRSNLRQRLNSSKTSSSPATAGVSWAVMSVGLSDNAWHDIGILRPSLTQHILRVDDSARFNNLPDLANFQLADRFYIGGIPDYMYAGLPRQIKSRQGFQGCLGSVDLDGDGGNLLNDENAVVPDEFLNDIVEGCQGTFLVVSYVIICSKLLTVYRSRYNEHTFSLQYIVVRINLNIFK